MHIPLDDLLQKNHLFPLASRGKLYNAAEHPRHLNRGKLHLLPAVFLVHQGGNIQRFIPDQRKRPGGIHRHRRQYRIYILCKIFIGKFRFLPAQVFVSADDLKTVLAKLGHQGAVVGGILELHQLVNSPVQGRQLLRGSHAGDIRLSVSGIYHVLQRGYPDHKKFVQIGGRDAQKLKPLKKRNILVPGFVQHPMVKQNPAQFPVRIIFRITKINFTHSSLSS